MSNRVWIRVFHYSRFDSETQKKSEFSKLMVFEDVRKAIFNVLKCLEH